MRTYTVHLPPGATPGDPLAFERALLVRDGFNWAAFFFTVLWMLWHRLWLAALLTALVFVGLSWGLAELGLGEGTSSLVAILLSILIGLESSTFRRWTYARRGMPVADVVAALDHEQADALACRRFLERPGADRQTTAPAMPPPLPPRTASSTLGSERPVDLGKADEVRS